ncbi:MAG: mechanosensitive ion channel [Sandaracinaceae bacterium]|nr:mechanosensitive ion channel [Sandaracinaceae bacterium]
MNEGSLLGDVTSGGWVLAWLLLGAALLYGALRLLRFAIDVVPLARERRETLRAAFPVVAAAAALGYLLLAAAWFFGPHPEHFPIAVAVIVGVALAASWFGVRDVVSGVLLAAGRLLEVGDHVRVGDVEGRVASKGLRAIVVETARGEEAVIPYGRLAREPVIRTAASERGARHVFEIELPVGARLAEVKRRAREAALTCHWSAIARAPEIADLGGGRLAVTVFAIDPDRVDAVESAVRAALPADAPVSTGRRG